MARHLAFLLLLTVSCASAQDGAAFGGASNSSQILTSTCQANMGNPCSGQVTVQASSADAFVDSMGTLFNPAGSTYPLLKKLVVDLGMRHVRSGGTSATYIANVKDLAAAGIKTQLVTSTYGMYSVDPTNFWSGLGQGISLVSWLTSTFGSNVSNIVDVVEAPNELDVPAEYSQTKWHPNDSQTLCATSNCGEWIGDYGVQYTKALYAAIKGNSETAAIKVVGPSIGYLFPSPFVTSANGTGNDLQGYVDWGGCHPYANGGNGYAKPVTIYDGVNDYGYYTSEPSNIIDQYPFAWSWCNSTTADGKGTMYGSTPIAPSEQGYFTGTSATALPTDVQAKYYPRMYAENFRHGMPRTLTYRFDDGCSDPTNYGCNWGLIAYPDNPKPAYYAMKSLISLLKEPGASFTPAALTYGVSVSANGAFTRTNYYHDLLLEKSNGDFYVLFWHEIADAAVRNSSGNQLAPATELSPATLPVTITVPSSISGATLYTYDANWNLVSQSLSIKNNQISIQAKDQISVLRLSSSAKATATTLLGSATFSGYFGIN